MMRILRLALAACFLLGWIFVASATEYDARYLRTLDADTHEFEITIWPQTSVVTKIRLLGIDTPETTWRASRLCRDIENAHGEKASTFAEDALQNSIFVKISNVKPDKFGGRFLANVRLSGNRLLSELLVETGFAVLYDGGKKPDWCDILK